jgi:hypothetical protein
LPPKKANVKKGAPDENFSRLRRLASLNFRTRPKSRSNMLKFLTLRATVLASVFEGELMENQNQRKNTGKNRDSLPGEAPLPLSLFTVGSTLSF